MKRIQIWVSESAYSTIKSHKEKYGGSCCSIASESILAGLSRVEAAEKVKKQILDAQ